MHTRTFVLLPRSTGNFTDAIQALLEPHRKRDDDPDDPATPWRWFDSWTGGDGSIADPETAAALGLTESEHYAENVCFVARLPANLVPGAIVTPDGVWHDSFEEGWRMTNGGEENRAADARWEAWVRDILARHPELVAVGIDTHS